MGQAAFASLSICSAGRRKNRADVRLLSGVADMNGSSSARVRGT
jgi:hypothetical protein